MADNLPAKLTTRELVEPFLEGTPFQRLLGTVLDELGGTDFVVEWAEENPTAFMTMLAATMPPPDTGNVQTGGNQLHVHLPEGLGPGPLDIVSEQ